MRDNYFNGLRILGPLDDYKQDNLGSLRDVMNDSVAEFPRTYAARIDLRLPNIRFDPNCLLSRDEIVSYNRNYTRLMKRFIESLRSKVFAQSQRKLNQGKRVHRNYVRYAWCRERCTSENDHYHLVLFFNKDRFHTLGKYKSRDSLASIIIEAWATALGMEFEDVRWLVEFPENHGYYLMDGKPEFNRQYRDLFRRISYLAKKILNTMVRDAVILVPVIGSKEWRVLALQYVNQTMT